MDIKKWLEKKRLQQIQFANMLGINKYYLNHVICGRFTPSVHLAKRIEELTEGAVSAAELLGITTKRSKNSY